MTIFDGPGIIAFAVLGIPRTQGSVRAVMPKGRQQPIVVQGSSKAAQNELSSWREAVAAEARKWRETRPAFEPLTCPVQVRLTFSLPKPASAPKTRRTWPVGARSGDLDKLARAVFDALTGVVWKDDAQVIGLVTSKDYGPSPGVAVRIRPVTQ